MDVHVRSTDGGSAGAYIVPSPSGAKMRLLPSDDVNELVITCNYLN